MHVLLDVHLSFQCLYLTAQSAAICNIDLLLQISFSTVRLNH